MTNVDRLADVTHTYYYANGKLVREERSDGLVMNFFYDQNGDPYAFTRGNSTYYYILNLQGDVVRIVNSSGSSYGIYRYDAWGNILFQTAGTILEDNPLRYRGYYYDTETGFYYLQSWYYDPKIGRFINADKFTSTEQNLLSYNMFAYCGNNPTMHSDKNGEMWELAVVGGGILNSGIHITLGTVLNSAAASLSAIPPLGLIVVGTVVVTAVVYTAVKYYVPQIEQESTERVTSPIGRRNTYNTKKKAKEAAKRAGGGKEPHHHPNGHDNNNKPHYHPNVSDKYRKTPHGVSSHDHYYYPK